MGEKKKVHNGQWDWVQPQVSPSRKKSTGPRKGEPPEPEVRKGEEEDVTGERG